MEKKIVCLTPSLKGFVENIGKIEGITMEESSLSTNVSDIVLFTGSILDKAEIDYRNITQTKGHYFTILTVDIKLNEVDFYWLVNTRVVYKSELINILLSQDNF